MPPSLRYGTPPLPPLPALFGLSGREPGGEGGGRGWHLLRRADSSLNSCCTAGCSASIMCWYTNGRSGLATTTSNVISSPDASLTPVALTRVNSPTVSAHKTERASKSNQNIEGLQSRRTKTREGRAATRSQRCWSLLLDASRLHLSCQASVEQPPPVPNHLYRVRGRVVRSVVCLRTKTRGPDTPSTAPTIHFQASQRLGTTRPAAHVATLHVGIILF